MNPIQQKFEELRAKNEKGFIPFLVIGDPTPELFFQIIQKVEPFADIIELGIPFSDPMADGPIIQAADNRALTAGTNLSNSYGYIKKIRDQTRKPIVVLTYANILGVEPNRLETLKKLVAAGVNGLIAADVPIEEITDLQNEAKSVGLDMILLVTPTTTNERLAKIAEKASGFLYLVSVKGVTGARTAILDETAQTIKRITSQLSQMTKSTHSILPVCVGFGISTPDHVKEIIKLGADGAIVGSAIIQLIEKFFSDPSKMLVEIEQYVRSLKEATKTENQKRTVSKKGK